MRIANKKIFGIKGQSLIEILVGVTIATIIIGGAAATIALTLRSNVQNKNIQTATSLGEDLIDKLTSFAEADWHGIFELNRSPSQYYLSDSGGSLSASSGSETSAPIDNTVFTRYFVVESVSRNPANDDIETVYTPANDDPSTLRITITVNWQEAGDTAEVVLTKVLTRKRNLIFHQTDWSGGSGQVQFPSPGSTNNRFDIGSGIDISTVGSIKVQGF